MSKNKMRNLFRFDNEIFSQSELNNYISSNKKLFKLKQTLIKLNNLDKNNYKHVIYGGSTSCCKLLCGLLTILGYENIYDENHKIKNKNSNYFAFLTFGNVYQKPLSKRTTQNIKRIFNSRPDNINGQKIKFIIILNISCIRFIIIIIYHILTIKLIICYLVYETQLLFYQ